MPSRVVYRLRPYLQLADYRMKGRERLGAHARTKRISPNSKKLTCDRVIILNIAAASTTGACRKAKESKRIVIEPYGATFYAGRFCPNVMTSNVPLRCSWRIFAKNDGAFDGKRTKQSTIALKVMIWIAGLSDLSNKMCQRKVIFRFAIYRESVQYGVFSLEMDVCLKKLSQKAIFPSLGYAL